MPCVQGVGSTTFTPPPNTSLTVPEICDWHYKHSGAHPLYAYVDETANKVDTVSWHTAVRGIYSISHSVIVSRRAAVVVDRRSDSFTYMLTILGIMRAGYPVFLISPFASPAALTHLIATSGIPLILTNPDDLELHAKLLEPSVLVVSWSATGFEVRQHHKRGDPVLGLCGVRCSILSWDQIFSGENVRKDGPDVSGYDLEPTCIILHSSGYGERDICGEIMSTASVPMAGAAGTMLALFPASSGLIIACLKPQSPPIRPNPVNVWKAITATKATYAFILQPFSIPDPGKRKILAQLKGVVFSGGPVQKSVGDQLALEGANLLTFFGSSEGGLLNNVFTNDRGADWEFFCFYSLINPAFIPQENNDLFELVIKLAYYSFTSKAGPFHKPTQTNIVCEDAAAFATKDLLLPHPQKPGFWKYINAVAFERMLALDPLIRGVVIFSCGKTFGVIIDPVYCTARPFGSRRGR
ncbi:hypothetical protein B0H10DRAFT_1956208 [Mycena sp. CBHHK59/15]|nr:hypothetical protein B0H10DRAFT_1956208 [Mycena sp. CBHHK59/15]